MIFWNRMAGMVTVTLTAAEPEKTLHCLNEAGVVLHQIRWLQPLTVQFQCGQYDRKKIKRICEKRGDQVEFSQTTGLRQLAGKLLRRPVLATGGLVFLFLTVFLPTRVLFIQVEGNERLPSRQILEAAADCGIRFGVSRRQVRSEKMKNTLLSTMPELKWAGINTAGCRAIISVRERDIPEEVPVSHGTANLVSVRDAYVTDLTVTRGSALCVPGQVVREGQVLISGYTDLGILLQVTQAQGEVWGETIRQIRTITPAQQVLRQEEMEDEMRLSLILGKKRINFGKGSGIYPATCGRMYQEYTIILPGGFRLPVSLAVERTTSWKTDLLPVSRQMVESQMQVFSRQQILAQTVAGRILKEDQTLLEQQNCHCLESRFLCLEMIGRISKEEIGEANGKTD